MRNRPISVIYILSNIDKALEFEWVAEHLDKSKFKLSIILLNNGDSELERFAKRVGIPCSRVTLRDKRDWISGFWQIRSLLVAAKPDIVHAHLLEAGIVGLAAALTAGIATRIYTRHHSTVHHVYHPHAVIYDKIVNWMATDVVAISENVERVLVRTENVQPRKVHLIHHGVPLDQYENITGARAECVRRKYNPDNRRPVIGVISRYTHWKGIQFVIPAFKALLESHPNAFLILANAGKGDAAEEIRSLLAEIPKDRFVEIAFENDIAALYGLFDVFVHVPIDDHCEAFGQVYIEALAAGIPSIFTLSGVALEFVRHNHNAQIVGYKDSNDILARIRELVDNAKLGETLAAHGREDVMAQFTFQKKIKLLEQLYSRHSPVSMERGTSEIISP